MKWRSSLLPAMAITILLSCVNQAFSQATTSFAQLNGTVQDANGAAIVKASITLRNLDTNRAYTATSNDVGYYIVPNLAPGRFDLTVTSAGFGKYTQTGIVLTVGHAVLQQFDHGGRRGLYQCEYRCATRDTTSGVGPRVPRG